MTSSTNEHVSTILSRSSLLCSFTPLSTDAYTHTHIFKDTNTSITSHTMPQLDPPGQGPLDPAHSQKLQDKYEYRPNAQELTGHDPSGPDAHLNSKTGVDYEPHPERSMEVSPVRKEIIKRITSLYSGSASPVDILVYNHESVYDDPVSSVILGTKRPKLTALRF